ncbi:MAG: adenosylcobinamide-phosphate synthase CbiB [Desulfobacterales bacterium]|jgi:adenosylcobinamide-phosphate synthase
MDLLPALYVLPIAFLLDLLFGDPRYLPHPIRWMGKAIETLEPYFRKIPTPPALGGLLFALALVTGTWCLTALSLAVARGLHPMLKTGLEIVCIYYCISARSLRDAAMEISRCLGQKNVKGARKKVALIVGRDVDKYEKDGIARAAVETVAENLMDGVISPLFFAAIGGAPLAMAYKMVNTLDSMVGYKNEKYVNFGKASARIDDILNYIPARLSIPLIAIASQLLAGKGMLAFKTAIREGSNHSSPNAGLPEAAFAGALNVKLNGPNYYNGKRVDKPYIGIRFGEARIEHIKKACDIMMLSSLLWLGILWGITAAVAFYR